MSERPEWFAPKRFGYGASLPIAWQGWALIAIYAALIGLAVYLFGNHSLAGASIVVPATALLILITARTTKGGWRWRSGEED
ncbi:hypothetical protein M8312_09980 [Sphingomonas sp. KRR8]|uniref:hypothetical protein n=1 Tax=Sphingomonas sp. KRR8 TaxID=2942996 RepID=UPI00201FBA32|nr:hypothetical protein [Sphingomonas sp. KRR8]URD60116.1 hypothetical protein M8312_09980 [Sphingomonas sp. KRR8]